MNTVSRRFEGARTGVSIPLKSRRQYLRFVAAIAVLLLVGAFVRPAVAQSYLTSTGSPSFAAPEPVELGFVNTANGNLHLSIPLGSYPQRGTSQPQAITLEYDSSIWSAQVPTTTAEWEISNQQVGWQLGGWYYSSEASRESAMNEPVSGCWTDITWADQTGTPHTFHLNFNYVGGQGCPSNADAFATDSSGYHMYFISSGFLNGLLLYAPDGTLVYSNGYYGAGTDPQGRSIIVKDSNGNYMSSANSVGVYDTLGRLVASGSGSYGSSTVSTSQGSVQYSLTYATINVNTNFQQSGVQETSTQVPVISSLTLPDAANSTYYFMYDCDSSSGNAACGSPAGQSAYYGELIRITLPTGGVVQYYYTNFKDAYGNKNQWVSQRTSAGGTWTYTLLVLSTCSSTQVNCKQQTTVTSPTGAQTVYTFQLNNGAWPTSTVQKDASGNALSTVNNTYDMSQNCVGIECYGNSFIRLTTQQTTVYTPGGSLKKQVSYTYDSPQTGNRTAIKEWKYTSNGSFSSVPDRATYITYLTTGTNNINRPLSVTVCNNSGSDSACPGGGSRISQALNQYDAYGTNGLSSITGIAQHDDSNFGVGYTTRGNVTSTSQWVSGSSYLTTSYTYDTTGQVLTVTNPALNDTHYSYGDNFFTDGGNGTTPSAYTPSQPTNAYPTSVTDAIGTQTIGYYWGSGKAAITTDYNSQSTYSHYQDGLDRPTEEIDPFGWELATYPSATESDVYTAVGDTSPSPGCNSCQHTQTNLDTWGRAASQILVNNPPGQINVDSTYDLEGRLLTQSHPYSGSSDPNHVFETFGYDALGRQLSTTHPDGQVQQVAFGARVGGLGGVTSQQGSTATYGYGYPQISLDESGHQRQQWTDGFGRIIEADEPSSSTSAFAQKTVSISGAAQSRTVDPCQPCQQYGCPPCPQTYWNYGYVNLVVGGYTASAYYNDSTASQMASALANVLNADPNSPVTASANGSSILLTARGPGASGNVSLSSSETFNSQSCGGYSNCFGSSDFVVSPASGSLSGGSGGIGASPYYTNYTYDAAGHLTQVVQGAQTRTFQYDGLGRKTYENTPEGGAVTYSYTTSGGLCSGDPTSVCSRTDARGVVSNYTYDHANRLTGVSYTIPSGQGIATMPNVCTTTPNNTSANVCNYYDQGGSQAHAIGRLTQMVDSTGSESYSYDAGGRAAGLSKAISGQTYNLAYQYDPSGNVTRITYPSGRVVYQAYNAIGQLCLISPTSSGCSGTGYYAGGFSYNAPGNLTGFTYGNGVTASFGFSAQRMQISSLSYKFGSQTYFNLGYWYQQNSSNCPNGATKNNGVIQCITDAVDGGRTVNYGYDPLSRLNSARTNGSSGFPQWGLSDSYDRYGNRLSQTVTAGSGPSSSLSFSAKNQPTGYTYDASGNMTVEPLSPTNNMTYDGENRMTAFSGNGGSASYTYDGNGLRVVKSISGGTTTVSIFAGSSVVAEYDNGAAPTAPSREYIYNGAGGSTTGLLAMISGSATTYYHQDHLSARLTTNGTGGIVTQEGHFPFGEQWYQSGSGNKWAFTSYQRDSESGLDYALARYYDSRTGTFCSADPLAGWPGDPQSWNRYPYGRNNPIDVTDPNGQHWWNWVLDIGLGALAGGLPAMLGAEVEVLSEGILGGALAGGTVALGQTSGQYRQQNIQPAQQGGRITCPPWTPIITGVGPGQALDRSPITGRVPQSGDAAINPEDFGESDYYQLAQQTGSADKATATDANKKLTQELKDLKNAHIQITPDWSKATSPQPSKLPSANGKPSGLPTSGPMTGDDIYAPPNPGHVDQYRYKTRRQANASTRKVPVTITLTPTGNVQCPH